MQRTAANPTQATEVAHLHLLTIQHKERIAQLFKNLAHYFWFCIVKLLTKTGHKGMRVERRGGAEETYKSRFKPPEQGGIPTFKVYGLTASKKYKTPENNERLYLKEKINIQEIKFLSFPNHGLN